MEPQDFTTHVSQETILRVNWDKSLSDLEPNELDPVKAIISRNLHLLPRWCIDLVIVFEFDDEDNAYVPATMETHEGYRYCKLTLLPALFDFPEDVIEETIVHEFIHVSVEPAVDFFFQSLDKMNLPPYIKSPMFKKMLDDVESTVTDLTDIITRDRRVYSWRSQQP